DYARARTAFTNLAALEPNNLEIKIDIAECLMEEGDLDGALTAVNAVIAAPQGKTLRTLILKSAIQKLLGQNEDAFKMLKAEKSLYWDLPEFLFPYHEACYRAGHDEEASEVFQKILELRGNGRIPEGVIQAKTIDELLEYSKSYRDHISTLNKQVLAGKLPWLGVAIAERSPALWHWALKTQPLPWIPEEPENVANFSIYSTNSFEIVADGDIWGFNRIAAPPQGTSIVIDYSALITLSRLGLTEKVLDRYGEIGVASPLVEQAVHERERLLPHQLSQVESWINIRQRILDKKIGLMSAADAPNYHYVAEYDKEDEAVTLRSLVDSLSKHGLVSTSLKDRLMKVSHKPAKQGVEIGLNAKLNIELITLKTLFGAGVLDVVLSNYEVAVLENSLDEMNRDLRAYDLQRKTYEWHDALWNQVREDRRFKVLPTPNLEGSSSEDRRTELFIAPFRLAHDTGRMLLTDDRAVQQWGNSIDRQAHGRAFGTDAVCDALLDQGALPISEIADAYLSLIRWRYKFLCPPPDILLEYARRYPGVTAGADLDLVARYVHDCMRDPGLYGGFENTTPKMSMAMQFYLGWSSAYATFLGSVWTDQGIEIERAELLTRWVCETALPAPPRATDLRVLPETSEQGKRMFLGQLGIALGTRAEPAKAERALRMAGALCNIDDDNLFLFLTEQMLQ
ncbi:MAG: tetratricopeptide repeat protein, partial [Nitrososphaerales archaeon]